MDNTKKICLTKGKTLLLTKTATETGEPLGLIKVGLSWGFQETVEDTGLFGRVRKFFGNSESKKRIVSSQDIDLDSAVAMYDGAENIIELVYFGNRNSGDESIQHLGDDRTGSDAKGEDGDNETILVDLGKVDRGVKFLAVILNSYSKETFDEVPFIRFRIYDKNQVFADLSLENCPEYSDKITLVIGIFRRTDDGLWKFEATGTASNDPCISVAARDGLAAKEVRRFL